MVVGVLSRRFNALAFGAREDLAKSEMEEVRRSYLEFCTQNRQAPSQELLKYFETTFAQLPYFLSCSGNIRSLGPFGVAPLCLALSTNQNVRILDLSRNRLGNEGAKQVSILLKANRTIRSLYLDSNEIEENGASSLGLHVFCGHLVLFFAAFPADALCYNRTLVELSMRDNRLRAGGIPLLTALQGNTTMRKLDLSGCQLTRECWVATAEALAVNATLRGLSVANNRLGPAGFERVAAALLGNRTLVALDLSRNPIGYRSGALLCTVLQRNPTLLYLDVSCLLEHMVWICEN